MNLLRMLSLLCVVDMRLDVLHVLELLDVLRILPIYLTPGIYCTYCAY